MLILGTRPGQSRNLGSVIKCHTKGTSDTMSSLGYFYRSRYRFCQIEMTWNSKFVDQPTKLVSEPEIIQREVYSAIGSELPQTFAVVVKPKQNNNLNKNFTLLLRS